MVDVFALDVFLAGLCVLAWIGAIIYGMTDSMDHLIISIILDFICLVVYLVGLGLALVLGYPVKQSFYLMGGAGLVVVSYISLIPAYIFKWARQKAAKVR